jgi:TolB-like protein
MWKKFLQVFVAAVVFFHVSAVLANIAQPRIAVLDFEQQGTTSPADHMGVIVSELLIASFVKGGRLNVVAKGNYAEIEAVKNLGRKDRFDVETVKAIRTVLGVDFIVAGSLNQTENATLMNSRLINTKNGKILSEETIEISDLSDLPYHIDQLSNSLLQYFPLDGWTVYVDLGTRQGLKKGMTLQVFQEETIGKLHEKERAPNGSIRSAVGTLKITAVHQSASQAIILDEKEPGIQYGHYVQWVPTMDLSFEENFSPDRSFNRIALSMNF